MPLDFFLLPVGVWVRGTGLAVLLPAFGLAEDVPAGVLGRLSEPLTRLTSMFSATICPARLFFACTFFLLPVVSVLCEGKK
jgi:hypothetical protein